MSLLSPEQDDALTPDQASALLHEKSTIKAEQLKHMEWRAPFTLGVVLGVAALIYSQAGPLPAAGLLIISGWISLKNDRFVSHQGDYCGEIDQELVKGLRLPRRLLSWDAGATGYRRSMPGRARGKVYDLLCSLVPHCAAPIGLAVQVLLAGAGGWIIAGAVLIIICAAVLAAEMIWTAVRREVPNELR